MMPFAQAAAVGGHRDEQRLVKKIYSESEVMTHSAGKKKKQRAAAGRESALSIQLCRKEGMCAIVRAK